MSVDDYQVSLPRSVALVLSDWLDNCEKDDWAGIPVRHRGELGALYRLAGILDKTVDDLFDPRYQEHVDFARKMLAVALDGEPEQAPDQTSVT